MMMEDLIIVDGTVSAQKYKKYLLKISLYEHMSDIPLSLIFEVNPN